MKKCLTITLFIILSSISISRAAPIISEFPTFNYQLNTSIDPDINRNRSVRSLLIYTKTNRKEMIRAMEMVLQEDIYKNYHKISPSRQNYALTLLMFLLSNNCYIQGDSITFALALANNHLYSIADKTTQKQIKKDIIDHFKYYKKIIKWQKSLKIRYDLSSVSVVPKIFWADRKRHMDHLKKGDKLTLKHYLEFIDRIENLEFMHNLLKKNNLASGESLIEIAQSIEGYAKKNLVYRADIEVHRTRLRKKINIENQKAAIGEYKRGKYHVNHYGKKRRWDHIIWLNYQLNLFTKTGSFRGDCMTATTFQMALYRAAGIPAFANQVRTLTKRGYSHNSPIYYNPFFKTWNSIQSPSVKEKKYYNYFSKPIWHHMVYEKFGKKYKKNGKIIYSSYWQGEKTTPQKIIALRTKGIQERHFNRIFFSGTTQSPGFIFNNNTAPEKLIDRDNDGILDYFEKLKGTDPLKADSDSDGYSDLWEIEHNFNPLNPDSNPGMKDTSIDGLALKYIRDNNILTLTSPEGDYNDI